MHALRFAYGRRGESRYTESRGEKDTEWKEGGHFLASGGPTEPLVPVTCLGQPTLFLPSLAPEQSFGPSTSKYSTQTFINSTQGYSKKTHVSRSLGKLSTAPSQSHCRVGLCGE